MSDDAAIPMRLLLSASRLAKAACLQVSLLLALSAGSVPAAAQAVGPETFASFSVRHVERIAPDEVEEIPADEPGQTGTDVVAIPRRDVILAEYGEHQISVLAQVSKTTTGKPTFLASGNHDFLLVATEDGLGWESARSEITARAKLVDRLTLENVGLPLGDGDCARVVAYFAVVGYDESSIDINPPEQLLHELRNSVRFEVRSLLGTREFEQELVGGQGVLEEDIDQKRLRVDGRVAAELFVCDNSFDVTMEFELVPSTVLGNSDLTVRNTFAQGYHWAAFAQSAELIGVVVYDQDDNILPNVQIVSQAGYFYPVLGSVPPEPEPTRVMIGPTAVTTDLGRFSDEVPPERTIDQSGLDKPYTSGETDFDAYFSIGAPAFAQATPYQNTWTSDTVFDLPVVGTVDFDLAELWLVDRIVIWNRSLADVGLLLATEPGGPWTEVGSVALESRYSFPFSYPADVIEVPEPIEARYLRLDVRSAHEFTPGDGFAYASVGEVAAGGVLSTIAIPEPAVGGLGGAAFAALAALAFRLRRSRSPATVG